MFLKGFLVSIALLFACFTTGGDCGLVRGVKTEDISKDCYYCLSDEKGVDNVEVCSRKNALEIERCPTEDMFDRCLVFEAFSTKLNTTVFRRECSSERLCTEQKLCSDSDYTNCKFLCCFGDLCNDFIFPAQLSDSKQEQGFSNGEVNTGDNTGVSPEYGEMTSARKMNKNIDEGKTSAGISSNCFYCLSEDKGVDNVEACSSAHTLDIEQCSSDDMFDRCLVFQAFSTKLNTTVSRRECSSERLCTSEKLCDNSDYVDCNFHCCFGDLCNDFDFSTKPSSNTQKEVQGGPVKGEKTSTSKEKSTDSISNQCYTCIGTDKGVDNIDRCSIERDLNIERCPTQDMFDQCMVFQAFSMKMNTTIFRRECTSSRFCSADILCADPDFVACKYHCCSGDLCNVVDFNKGGSSTTEEPKIVPVHKKTQAGSEVKEEIDSANSLKCYYCDGIEEGKDDIETCSIKNQMESEICPNDQNGPYKCISFQAFISKTNTTSIRRECIPERLCIQEMVCSSPDYNDCKFKCCNEKLCNDFDFNTGTSLQRHTTEMMPSTQHIPTTSSSGNEKTTSAPINGGEETQGISKRCYYCIGDKSDGDNIEACSRKDALEVKMCPSEFDRCMVYQAFSLQKRNVVFRRECTSRKFCNQHTLCNDPNLLNCQFQCCSGDNCNDFNFKSNPNTITRPTGTTTKPDTSNGKCKDIDPNCQKYPAKPMYLDMFCADNSNYTSVVCRKSCKFCTDTDNEYDGNPPRGPNSEPPTTKYAVRTPTQEASTDESTKIQGCRDMSDDCPQLASQNYCNERKPFMRKYCQKTCGFCTPCRDRKDCVYYAGPYYCRRYREFMMINCPITCNFCTPESGKPTTPYYIEHGVQKCEDRRKECVEYASVLGYCHYTRYFMVINCPKACGFCGENKFQSGITNTEKKTKPDNEGTNTEILKEFEGTNTEIEKDFEGGILKMVIDKWGKCKYGIQKRDVHCFHILKGDDGKLVKYKIAVKVCIKYVAKMPAKQRAC